MKNVKIKLLSILALGVCACFVAPSAHAWNNRNGFRDGNPHPRRAEVLNGDRGLRNEIRNDRGQLGGNYNNLMARDRNIRRQEQRDARMNGGHITRQEENRFNRRENRLQNAINRNNH